MKNSIKIILLLCGIIALSSYSVYAITDTYLENFDGRQDETTINGVDSWSVDQGDSSGAITQNSTTYTGSGNSLELIGAETTVNVSRSASYGSNSPCWLEFIVKPNIGAQARSIPSGKIAAVYFSHTGIIYASDGSSWADTGETFTAGQWYHITLKLDFSTHLYSIYIEPVAAPDIEFIPSKENLNFIDNTISSLSQVGFEGVYSTAWADDTYIDDLVIHFIDRIEIITAPQNLMQNQASSPFTVQLQNSYSEPQTAWKDITLELRTTSECGEFSLDRDSWKAISQVTVPKEAQSAAFYYKDSKAGKVIVSVKEYPDRGWEEASQQVKIVSDATYFDITATTPQTAGEYFNVEITARDDEGQVNEFYSGEIDIFAKYVSPYSGTMAITPVSASGFSKGMLSLEIMYPDCGVIEITAQDRQEPSKTGYSGEILFVPAAFSVFAESPQAVSAPFILEVTALNAQGQTALNYQGSAALSAAAISPASSCGTGITPSSISGSQFLNGLAEVNVKYSCWGTINIEVCDEAYPARKGSSDPVNFVPSGILVEVKPASSERDFFYTGETFELAVSLVDAEQSPIANYQGKIGISSTPGFDLPYEYQFLEGDQGKKVFLATIDSPGLYAMEAKDEQAQLSGKSPSIKVKQAVIEVISTSAPVGAAEVVIQLVDDEGNIITSENELTLQVELEEEVDDSSASSSATREPVTFKNGKAKVLISNVQAETVTISPKAAYDFKIKKGTITFGRIAKTGVGTLMWREVKE